MKRITLLLLFCIILCGCSFQKQEEEIRPVKYIKVQRTPSIYEKDFPGIVTASLSSTLSFRVEGSIIATYVSEGDFVKRGQPLAKLDASLYNVENSENRAMLEKTRIDAQNANSYYKRMQLLYEEGAISARQFDDAKDKAAAYKSEVQASKDRLNYSSKLASYGVLYAPEEGYITQKLAQAGTYVKPGNGVFEFISSNNPQIQIFIPQNLVNDVYLGQGAQIHFDALKDQRFTGKIIHINESTYRNPAFSVKIAIPTNPLIKNGMSASVNLDFRHNRGQREIIVPINSVSKDDNGNYVWLLIKNSDTTAISKKKYVQTGSLNEDKIIIKSGLSEGENIVSAGADFIQEGLKVKPLMD